MKAHSSYFRQKNSKQGLALSTAMAICIVLALLVAILVSMASLNITTTQATVSQREAYIQAKSALAFAESYYSKHTDQIPGNGDGATTGEGLMVFNTDKISDGASVYIIGDDVNPNIIDPTTVQNYKNNAVDTYIEVSNTASILDLTAYCKYGNGSAYKLSKEYKFRNSNEPPPNAFTGNIVYKPTSDTRYLRIHVRTSPAFTEQPFLYAWYTTVNDASGDAKGKSSIVNKMAQDTNYATVANGTWDGERGPVGDGAMVYEGNSWYVTEMKFSSNQKVNFVNAVVARANSHRTGSGGAFYYDAQSWEFFGIPVPLENMTGEANGLDVYITLNQKTLQDALQTGSNNGTDGHDDLTYMYENQSGTGTVKLGNFVKECSTWYTVYTKKDTATVHYRKANVYDNSTGISGFTYEGYGWWRNTSNNFGDYVTINGNIIHYDQGRIVSQNKYGKEVVRELFIVEAEDGEVQTFGTEAEANNWLFGKGDLKAGDYVAVNVKANDQPVDAPVETKISYKSTWIEDGGAMPTPSSPNDTDNNEDADDETDTDGTTGVAYSNKELEVRNLSASTYETSGSNPEYAVIGFPNNWGRSSDSEPNSYDYLHNDYLEGNGFEYTRTYTNLNQGTYEFKIIEMIKTSGLIKDDSINFDGWKNSYGNGSANYIVNVSKNGNNIVIKFNRSTGTINAYEEDPSGGGGGGSTNPYVIAGWMNDFGRNKDGVTNSTNVYELTHDMTLSGGAYTYTSDILESGKNYTFKILEKLASSGSISEKHGWDADHCYGGTGDNRDTDGNFVLHMDNSSTGDVIRYYVDISFDPSNKSINVLYHVMGSSADDTYYLVGTFNNWAGDQYDQALAYPLKMTGKDAEGHPVYSIKLTNTFEASQLYEFKVISSSSKLDTPDANGKTINYEESWGAPDAARVTKGADKAAFSFTLEQRSRIEIQFTFNKEYSTITYTPKVIDPFSIVGTVDVGFHNGPLENINDHSTTAFTTPWSQVYVTYETPDNFYCFPLDMTGTNVWGKVPEDAEYIYFSNMPTEDFGKPGYEYTENIESSKFVGITNAIFFPKTSTTNAYGVLWSFGDTDEYRTWTSTVTSIEKTETMAYSGGYNSGTGLYSSTQNNYYDAPIVKVLNMLVTGDPDGNGSHYAYAAYPYKKFNVSGGAGTISFKEDQTVSYQGETYYWINTTGYNGYSFLIIQDTTGKWGGILLENHMALMTDPYSPSGKTMPLKMNNRGGGVFTSDTNYYNGEESKYNYKGYTPNWYTYKVPVSSELVIKKITGVTSSGAEFVKNSAETAFTPAKAGDHYNQPLYIYQAPGGTKQCYTYDIDTGHVDTNKDEKASIYFEDTEGWGEVWVHAYNALGKTADKKIDIDGSDSDTSYYRFEFNAGDYCYFVFYDHMDNADYKLATRKSPVHYFTGEENSDRQYQILAKGRDSGLTWYLHPQTKALYAYLDLDTAVAATMVPKYYSYNAKTNEYTGAGGNYTMTKLQDQANAAKGYANGSGPWSNSGSANYSDLAAAAVEFSKAISDARIYISEEIPESVKAAGTDTNYTGSHGIYREGAYRDDIVTYETRWVNALKNAYNDAIAVYSDGNSQKNAATLRQKAADINALINAPETVLNPNAVQIIVDDQKAKDSSAGLWGKSNIHLYNLDGGVWRDLGYDIYDTTQADEGYYAYVFKLNLSSNVFQIAKSLPDVSDAGYTLAAGNRYIFHTATNTFELDTSVHTVTCTYNEIKEGSFSESYRDFTSATNGEEFVIYFKNDTRVHGNSQDYSIYAGAYMISAKTYANFTTDVSGKTGINLFTESAKKFFTSPGRYGMSAKTDYDSTWSSNINDTANDIDIMVESVGNAGSTLEAKTSQSRTVAFRYDGRVGQDTLTLAQNINLEGGIVSIAANNIKIPSAWDFTINAKTIIFYTDTMVTTPSGSTFRVAHGTYIFNESESSTASAEIKLSSTGGTGGQEDWRNHYILIDEVASELRGGTYVVKN